MRLLLDTHVLLWWVGGDARLPASYRARLAEANAEAPVWLAEISLWEIANLRAVGRIELSLPLLDWLEMATTPPLVQRVGISPMIAARVAALPATFHRDPADRLIVATAQVLGATLLTCDRAIRESGLVPVLE